MAVTTRQVRRRIAGIAAVVALGSGMGLASMSPADAGVLIPVVPRAATPHKVIALNDHPVAQPSIVSKYRLDSRCMTGGRVMCINKATNKLVYLVSNRVVTTMDARFGCRSTYTRNGVFSVYWKDIDHVSGQYDSAMPYSMFFSGGQAVHYSADFSARGYAGCSHGCVNIRDRRKLAYVYGQVHVGDRVVVYSR